MLIYNSTINAFQKTLSNFTFADPKSFSEDFAQQRFKKKFEVPGNVDVDLRASACWSDWIDNDARLPDIHLPPGEWYRVRMHLHRCMLPIRQVELRFPKGSEFNPTRGHNSIEARLCESRWTCTADNFSRMAAVCYSHKALKRAVRSRYKSWFRQKQFDISMAVSDKFLFSKFKHSRDPGFDIFTWKLSRVVSITHGARFTTIPKNNLVDRPANVEPFGNMITQLAIGAELRAIILREFNVDLDTLADTHRMRIKSDFEQIATIDLRNASDSISLSLCSFVLPKWILNKIEETRSPMVLGPDGSYHLTKKVSAMGNGFTFELMTLILLCVCRTLDANATVFGDDIIIDRLKAPRLMHLLTSVGLQINEDKSFIDGPFRESCGGNYHVEEGYIESYDFYYPETIGDCVILWNKVVRLAPLYDSFKKLSDVLYRSLPKALHGGPNHDFQSRDMIELIGRGSQFKDEGLDHESVIFPLYFVTPKYVGEDLSKDIVAKLKDLCYGDELSKFRLIPGFEFKSELRSPTRASLHPGLWAKYEMYLHAGRRTKDVKSNAGKWVRVWFVTSGTITFRVSALMI